MPLKRIAITPGEPAGIGADILLALIQEPLNDIELIAIADPELLEQRAQQLSLPLNLYPISSDSERKPQKKASLGYIPVKLSVPVIPGQLNMENSSYVIETLNVAASGCINKKFDALVTGPVHKGIINDADIAFTGHTEYLATLSNTDKVVMMLATKGLRVALVTTHLPLSKVSDSITSENLEAVIRILHSDLINKFQIDNPKIIICGLNPHAGEDGYLGLEEIEIIQPTLERLVNEGMHLMGPLPADTAFTPDKLSETDAVLSMYHDQGLPVIKHMGFSKTVNITLGLPFIRTSVDHGTALTLSATGKADIGSLREAIHIASEMIK